MGYGVEDGAGEGLGFSRVGVGDYEVRDGEEDELIGVRVLAWISGKIWGVEPEGEREGGHVQSGWRGERNRAMKGHFQ